MALVTLPAFINIQINLVPIKQLRSRSEALNRGRWGKKLYQNTNVLERLKAGGGKETEGVQFEIVFQVSPIRFWSSRFCVVGNRRSIVDIVIFGQIFNHTNILQNLKTTLQAISNNTDDISMQDSIKNFEEKKKRNSKRSCSRVGCYKCWQVNYLLYSASLLTLPTSIGNHKGLIISVY